MDANEDLSRLTAKGLLRLHAEILQQFDERGICTTKDNPIGGYGEWLAVRAFGGVRQANSNRHFDVLTPDGTRLQVKTRWLPLGRELRQLSAVRDLDKGGFDFIVALLLDKDFEVAEAYQIPHAAVGRLASRTERTNSHRLVLSPRVCRDLDCLDITEKLRAADLERSISADATLP